MAARLGWAANTDDRSVEFCVRRWLHGLAVICAISRSERFELTPAASVDLPTIGTCSGGDLGHHRVGDAANEFGRNLHAVHLDEETLGNR